MVCPRQVALSGVALLILAIIKKKNSSSKAEDFINQLPDDILKLIVRRLPTRDAARTSVLSKRWRNLHTFLPHVDFDCLHMLGLKPEGPLHYDNLLGLKEDVIGGVNILLRAFFGFEIDTPRILEKKFIKGVDRFLHQFSRSRIKSCQLGCCFTKFYPNKLGQWIHSLGRLGVEELTLKFMCTPFTIPYNYEFPPSFSSQLISEAPSLKYLKLIRCTLEPNLKNQCRNLKSLHLSMVNICPGSVECILSNCLNLESLMIVFCMVNDSKLSFRGPNLQLKHLTVFGSYCIEKIEMYASNLTTFEYFGVRLIDFSFDHIPKLESFSIRVRSKSILDMLYAKLARPLPFLFIYRKRRIPTGMNFFSNLRRLELGFFIYVSDKLAIASVLILCPLLEEFNFVASYAEPQEISKLLDSNEEQVNGKRNIIVDNHTQLKKVGFSGFTGTRFETEYVLYFLRSAINLEQMNINLYYKYYVGPSRWEMCDVPWDEDKCKRMCRMYQLHAISKIAKITISHKRWMAAEDVHINENSSSFSS